MGDGRFITRLGGGELVIEHNSGEIVFRLRSPHQIQKRGTDIILKITNAGHIPRLEGGVVLSIDCMKVGLDVERPEQRTDDRREPESSEGDRRGVR